MGKFGTFMKHLRKGDLGGVTRNFRPDFLGRPIDLQKRSIYCASSKERAGIVKYLINYNCDIECENMAGWRPIHEACILGHVDIVKFLTDRNCDIECQTIWERRPIHFACLKGDVNIVKLLVRKGCELQCKDKFGQTPFDLAKQQKHCACEDFLTEAVKVAQFFDCIRRNQYQTLEGLNCADVLTAEEPKTGLSFLEVVLQSNATEVIEYVLDKRVDDAEIPPLKHYIETCYRSVPVDLIQECLLYRSIRYHHADGFELSCLPRIVNGHRNMVKSSFLEIATEFGTCAFITEILRKSIYNKEEWTRAKHLAVIKNNVEIAIAIAILIKENQENPIPGEDFTDNSEDMIMISYCHKDGEIVKRIYDELKKRRFKLWIDFEHMGSEMNQSMGLAVEQSKAVVVCVSSGYQASVPCKKEMTYAQHLKKCIVPVTVENNFTPKEWLGIGLSDLWRINMSGKYDFETSMSKLIEYLHRQVINKCNSDLI